MLTYRGRALAEPTRIIAIRHGETAWNVDTRIQGHLDIPLSANGRWQAERLADALKDASISAIYASDLTRAWETSIRRPGAGPASDQGNRLARA